MKLMAELLDKVFDRLNRAIRNKNWDEVCICSGHISAIQKNLVKLSDGA